MQSIITYQNYRNYIQDFYDENKNRYALTWKIFAEKAGFASPSYLKLVCQKKANLSEDGIAKTARSMNLVGYEKTYFENLVRFNQATVIEEKEKAFKVITEIALKHKAVILKEADYDYYSNWLNIVMRELAPQIQPGTKAFNVARQIVQPVKATDITNSLKFLLKNGMLKKNSDGTFEQTDKILSTGDKDIASMTSRTFHKKMAEFGMKAIDEISLTERHVSDIVIGITKDNYTEIVKEIRAFRKRILAIATNNDDMERVYCMQTNLFPLTHKTNKKRSKK